MSTQYKISDPALIEALKQWTEVRKTFSEKYTALERQFQQEAQTLVDGLNRTSRDAFRKCCEHYKVGGDHDEHYKTGAWYISFTFFEQHGDVYLCQAESPIGAEITAKPTEEKKHQLN